MKLSIKEKTYLDKVLNSSKTFKIDNNAMKRWNYQLENWENYNLVDTKEDFVQLLNILQFNEETLDSLHDVVFNNYDMFCGIVGTWDNDREVVQTLNDFHKFFSSREELEKYLIEECEYYNISLEEYVCGEAIYKTKDGYVHKLYY